MGTCLFSIAKQTCGFFWWARNNLKPVSNCLFWESFSFNSSFWVSKKSFINPQKPAYFWSKTPFWAHSATHKNPKVEKCANRKQIVGLWPPLFPDLNFLLLWGQTGKKSCSQNALLFVLRKKAYLGCFSAYIYCRFLRSKITKKKLSISQSVLILKSDLSEWTRIRRRLAGLGGSRRSNSTLENRAASTEHFSSQISARFATLRKKPVSAN